MTFFGGAMVNFALKRLPVCADIVYEGNQLFRKTTGRAMLHGGAA